MRQRFGEPRVLVGMNERSAAALVAGRLAPVYAAVGFVPPARTWPFSDGAIADAAAFGMMPRTLLTRCDGFRRPCLATETVGPCTSLLDPSGQPPVAIPGSEFDRAAARRAADITGIHSVEDARGMVPG